MRKQTCIITASGKKVCGREVRAPSGNAGSAADGVKLERLKRDLEGMGYKVSIERKAAFMKRREPRLFANLPDYWELGAIRYPRQYLYVREEEGGGGWRIGDGSTPGGVNLASLDDAIRETLRRAREDDDEHRKNPRGEQYTPQERRRAVRALRSGR